MSWIHVPVSVDLPSFWNSARKIVCTVREAISFFPPLVSCHLNTSLGLYRAVFVELSTNCSYFKLLAWSAKLVLSAVVIFQSSNPLTMTFLGAHCRHP